MNRTPAISSYQLAIICAPLLAMAAAAVAYGEHAAGLFAAAVTLILWAAILRFTNPGEVPAARPVETPRPPYVGPSPMLPAPHAPQWKDPLLAERVSRVAADPRAPEGERAAARAALRRLRVPD